jgi:phospholipid/cholesterol/gamma-HCH transport system substrate-binding protein
MGGKYIALIPGGDPKKLSPGENITYTQSSISFEALIGKYLFSGKDDKSDEVAQEEKSKKKEKNAV